MTGRELIQWILDNHAEDMVFMTYNGDIDAYFDANPQIKHLSEEDKMFYQIEPDNRYVVV